VRSLYEAPDYTLLPDCVRQRCPNLEMSYSVIDGLVRFYVVSNVHDFNIAESLQQKKTQNNHYLLLVLVTMTARESTFNSGFRSR